MSYHAPLGATAPALASRVDGQALFATRSSGSGAPVILLALLGGAGYLLYRKLHKRTP